MFPGGTEIKSTLMKLPLMRMLILEMEMMMVKMLRTFFSFFYGSTHFLYLPLPFACFLLCIFCLGLHFLAVENFKATHFGRLAFFRCIAAN